MQTYVDLLKINPFNLPSTWYIRITFGRPYWHTETPLTVSKSVTRNIEESNRRWCSTTPWMDVLIADARCRRWNPIKCHGNVCSELVQTDRHSMVRNTLRRLQSIIITPHTSKAPNWLLRHYPTIHPATHSAIFNYTWRALHFQIARAESGLLEWLAGVNQLL